MNTLLYAPEKHPTEALLGLDAVRGALRSTEAMRGEREREVERETESKTGTATVRRCNGAHSTRRTHPGTPDRPIAPSEPRPGTGDCFHSCYAARRSDAGSQVGNHHFKRLRRLPGEGRGLVGIAR